MIDIEFFYTEKLFFFYWTTYAFYAENKFFFTFANVFVPKKRNLIIFIMMTKV